MSILVGAGVAALVMVLSLTLLARAMPQVECPRCRTLQSRVRRPRTRRHMLWGGWTCPGCQAELDRRGHVIREALEGRDPIQSALSLEEAGGQRGELTQAAQGGELAQLPLPQDEESGRD